VILLLLLGCESAEVRERHCVGPLVELVRWRDEREHARLYKGEDIVPARLAEEERAKVEATAAALAPHRTACEMTWSVLMHQPPDNPALRLREEAILRVLGLPARTYDVEAVGWAGVSVSGMAPLSASGAR
jgi:hypothetical protein